MSQSATRYRSNSSVTVDARLFVPVLCFVVAVIAYAAPAFGAPPGVSLGFTWSPPDPVVGQQVTFISTATADGNNSIQAELWDLNGDGQFGDRSGHSVLTVFSTPGSHTVGLRVVDKHAAEHNHVLTQTVNVRPFTNLAPSASFVHYPASPQPGQVVHFHSTAADPDSPIGAQRWDLDGNGSYGDALGPTASRTFALPGRYTIGLQVEDTLGAVNVALKTLEVSESVSAAGAVGALRQLFPFPIVSLSGTITKSGIRVRRLTVDAPAGTRTAVRCRGSRCPFRWRRYSHRSAVVARVIRVRGLNGRFLRARTTLQVFVTRKEWIGRYTRFKVRSGKPPERVDRCLISTARRPVRCPAA